MNPLVQSTLYKWNSMQQSQEQLCKVCLNKLLSTITFYTLIMHENQNFINSIYVTALLVSLMYTTHSLLAGLVYSV